MHGNRETSAVPDKVTGRSGKACGHNPDMHAAEDSDFGLDAADRRKHVGQGIYYSQKKQKAA
ncbi:MAG TPA: hypothetical protein VHZ07_25580 [Bryobacteraceae bacterium]|jgi:hypothetical protein|nr:hypothetical protein [Bryobacteraceae bacterium]